MKFVRRVYENGKLTVPKEIRDIIGIEDGDFVQVEVLGVVRKNDRKEA